MFRMLMTSLSTGVLLLSLNAPLHAQQRSGDTFVPKTAVEHLVYECTKASGADMSGKRPMTIKEVRDTTTCIDLIKAAVLKSK